MTSISKSSAPSAAVETHLSGRIAWVALLASAALVPLTTSITRGAIGGTFGVTNELYHVPKLLLLAVLVAVATVAWGVDVALGERPLRVGLPTWMIGGFAVLVLVSTAVAPEAASSFFGARGLMTGATTWLLSIWAGFLVTQYLTAARVREVSWALVGGSVLVGAIAILEALGADPLGTPFGYGYEWVVRRGISTVGNPDFTGMLLVLPTVLALALASSTKDDRERWIGRGCAVVLAIATMITLTRAAWIGAAVGIGILVVLSSPDRRTVVRRAVSIASVAVTAVVVALAFQGTELVLGRVTDVSKGLDAFSSGRVSMWADTLRSIAKYPLFGTGADHLAIGTYQVQQNVVVQGFQRLSLQDPHSLPLLVAGVFGIPALVVFAATVAIVVRSSWRSVRPQAGQSDLRVLFAGWFAGFIGVLIASLLSVWSLTAVFVLFLAMGVLAAPAAKPLSAKAPAFVAVGLGVVLAAVSVFGAGRSFAASREEALSTVVDPPTHLARAMSLVPWDAGTRVNYLWRKIQATAPILTSDDARAARKATAALDAEIRLDIARFPHELLLYRLRIDLYTASRGYAGFQPQGLVGAIDDAIAAFPGDREFTAKRADALKAAGSSY